MNFYAPLFSKIVDSSIWTEPDYVVKIFLTMIAKQDRDSIVRGTAFNISCWAKKTEAETIEALKILAAPDTKRIEPQPYDGRRIEKVDEGYLILNGMFYRQEMQKINRRVYKTTWQREARQEPKVEQPESTTNPRFKKPTFSELVSEGMPKSEAGKFLNYYDSCGWTVGKNKPMKDWRAAVRGWLARAGVESGDEEPMTKEELLRQATM